MDERNIRRVEISAPNVGPPREDADILPQRLLLDSGGQTLGNPLSHDLKRQPSSRDAPVDGYNMEPKAGLASRLAPGRPRRLTTRQEQKVFRWINGNDPRQYGLDFGLWTRSVCLT